VVERSGGGMRLGVVEQLVVCWPATLVRLQTNSSSWAHIGFDALMSGQASQVVVPVLYVR
jgi:hypothetical protein